MSNEEAFVNELISYIFAYPDDDYMTMECLCRKLHKHELIAKVNGHWQPLDKRCEECIFVEGSHWCNDCDKTPKGMKEYDEYWANADRKDEPQKICKYCNGRCSWWVDGDCMNDDDCRFKPKDEPQTDCNGCKFVGTYDTEFPCANCSRKTKDYYAKTEPQTHEIYTETHACVEDEPQTERSE